MGRRVRRRPCARAWKRSGAAVMKARRGGGTIWSWPRAELRMRDVRRRDMVCGVFSLCVSGEGSEVFGPVWDAIAVGRSNVG